MSRNGKGRAERVALTGRTPARSARSRAEAPRGPYASVEEAIREIRRGRMVVVVDDKDREDEGDFIMAAGKATPEAVNFMAREARGLICVSFRASGWTRWASR